MHSLKLNKYDAVIHFATGQTLGVTVAVTNANGNIIARQSFDAWGRRRKVQDYSYLPQNTASTDNGLNNNGTLPKWLYRGYTGHEHLDEFALINMNARLYDPVVGMFLSPDNYIQAPANTQNYNRYAYCLNNPLKYSDPSGNRFTSDDVGYIALAGVFGAASWKPIFDYSFGNATTGQAIGMYAVNATAFVASAGVGSAVSSVFGIIGFVPGFATAFSAGFVGGSISGSGSTWINGGSFTDGINKGLIIGTTSGIVSGTISGTISGINAYNNGRNFWTGKYTYNSLKRIDVFLTEKPVDESELEKFLSRNFDDRIKEMEFEPSFKVSDFTNDNGRTYFLGDDYSIAGKSRIELSRINAFKSELNLYTTIDHELVHAELYSNGVFAQMVKTGGYCYAKNMSEVYAYQKNMIWASDNYSKLDPDYYSYLNYQVRYFQNLSIHCLR